MKKKISDFILIFLTLLFLVLFFKYNLTFKKCILNGCTLFFYNVLPTLLPMFIINDILLNYNFGYYINKIFNTIFYKIFKMSKDATYILIMACFSGTPTNAYLTTNLVKNHNLPKEEAGIILAYAFFINPLFLYNMLNNIFNNSNLSFKIILICYLTNFLIAFFYRKYPYQINKPFEFKKSLSFSKALNNSLKKSMATLLTILGTIIFYLVISEGINLFIKNDILNCIFNGFLEITGGLNKLAFLNISLNLKKILAIIFISFGSLSIHSQIKGIILEEKIPFHYFFKTRFIQIILATTICLIST